MLENDGYWKIKCDFPFENKELIISLSPEIKFRLDILAKQKKLSAKELAEYVINKYVSDNYKKNNPLSDLFK
jgi:hypothetical protein